MKPKNIRRQQEEIIRSGIFLRKDLGDDETIPKSFSVSTSATPVQINTNVFPVVPTNLDATLYQYNVEITPEILNAKLLTNFVYSALFPEGGKMSENQKWHSILFDGSHIIFSDLSDLSCENSVTDNSTDENKNVTVKITLEKEIHLNDNNESIEALQKIYGTAFHRAYQNLGLTSFRKKWLNDQDVKQFGNFKIIGGFKPALYSLQNGLAFIVDLTSRLDRQGNLYDYLKRGITNPNERSDFSESMKYLNILTTHSKKQKLIKVSAINWNNDPSQVTIDRQDKKTGTSSKISLAEYFQQVHNFTVQRDDPIIEVVLNVDGEQKINMYPASCLKVTGITEAEKINNEFMTGLRNALTVPPTARKQKLDLFVSRLRTNPDAYSFFSRWGIEIGDSLTVTGHVFEPPVMKFRTRHSNHAETNIKANDKMCFKNELRNTGVAVPPRLNTSPLILAPLNYSQDVKSRFVPKLIDLSKEIGITLLAPYVIELEDTTSTSYRKEICEHILKGKGTPSFIIVIFPADDNKERYDSIKYLLTVEMGIPSQFVKSSVLFAEKPGLQTVTQNLLYQITAKTGGICYYVSHESLPLQSTMVVGISMMNGRGQGSSGTVCAMTASYDQTFARYFSDSYTINSTSTSTTSTSSATSSENKHKTIPPEFIDDFLKRAINRYVKQKSEEPKRVVIFRDDVSFGLMKKVKQEEVKAAVDAIGESISLVFCIVQKQSHLKMTRKVSGESADSAGSGEQETFENPRAGTVISDGIGICGIPEFYMVSHDVTQGMATPTKYTIIHHFPYVWKDDQLAKLTHYLTCDYPNWPGAIRIPCPLMLASKLAEQVKNRLSSSKPHESLSDFLHYL